MNDSGINRRRIAGHPVPGPDSLGQLRRARVRTRCWPSQPIARLGGNRRQFERHRIGFDQSERHDRLIDHNPAFAPKPGGKLELDPRRSNACTRQGGNRQPATAALGFRAGRIGRRLGGKAQAILVGRQTPEAVAERLAKRPLGRRITDQQQRTGIVADAQAGRAQRLDTPPLIFDRNRHRHQTR